MALELGFEKIIIKNNALIITFPSVQQSEYYKSEIFEKIIKYINQQSGKFKLKQTNNKLNLIISNVKDIDNVAKIFEQFKN